VSRENSTVLLVVHFTTYSESDYVASTSRIMEDFKETDIVLIEVLSCRLFKECKVNHEEYQPSYTASRPRFEASASRVQVHNLPARHRRITHKQISITI
jgi:hypothetical protein